MKQNILDQRTKDQDLTVDSLNPTLPTHPQRYLRGSLVFLSCSTITVSHLSVGLADGCHSDKHCLASITAVHAPHISLWDREASRSCSCSDVHVKSSLYFEKKRTNPQPFGGEKPLLQLVVFSSTLLSVFIQIALRLGHSLLLDCWDSNNSLNILN